MPQVIEWTNAGSDAIVWRCPVEEITWGSQLVVQEFQVAMFFRDGKAYDTFGPGRHTLTTQNLPLLTGLLTRIAGFGGNKPFKASVIFISTKIFAGKWGTKAQTTELAPLQTYGQFWFKIENVTLFVNEVIGGQSAYTTEQVNSFLRGYLNEKIIDELSHYDLLTVFTRLDETSIIVKNHLIDYFKRVGIELTDLKFEGIDTTPEYRERLFWLKTGQTAPSEVLRMETMKSAAESLGKGGGSGALGAGMVLIPQIMNQQVQQPQTAAPVTTLVICPKCSEKVPATSKFCPSCGTNLSPPTEGTMSCSKCNKTIPANSKFCPECGNKAV
ncbi:MAG: SPFH domain-containing protein [Candidatus Bathyarchaeota archaeon]|uniref:SPFH domain-containing protein n=1 Tax=Candidatus Bathycorpusculum sp. TaxID=2994959 RepID=UPI00282B922C|nr:SPFH domain-containing protein [Candidatus Termiticorpusculum sp.]MCL2256888.1 SPFH domain-containing protein [Candidatus Termiticorpusculum sp.]MCL2292992.1 SPFH domain-containing protein [Candidatus Termiticorpusculum sp.]